MTKKQFDPVHAAAHGYTKQDWDEVESPDITAEEIAQGPLRFVDVFPELARRKAGRPKLESPKAAVTLRLDPATVERFKSAGPDWRARMAEALDKARV
jgi:uncharacterized protein (DUF4415 family)